jgi:hypothetical protein
MMSLLALHGIAAQRGDGLHPALVSLLERSDGTENHGTSPALLKSSDRSAALSLNRRGSRIFQIKSKKRSAAT